MGPAILTTIGILFLLGEFAGHVLSFWRTFPVILIVIGAILLASSVAPSEGHIDTNAPTVPPPPANSSYQGPQGPGR